MRGTLSWNIFLLNIASYAPHRTVSTQSGGRVKSNGFEGATEERARFAFSVPSPLSMASALPARADARLHAHSAQDDPRLLRPQILLKLLAPVRPLASPSAFTGCPLRIALGLGIYMLTVSPAIVEPLIALSISSSPFENIFVSKLRSPRVARSSLLSSCSTAWASAACARG